MRAPDGDPAAPGVPWWAVGSSVVAPVAMIGGWLVAAARQPPGYSAVRQTISALAAHGAHDRWVMTAGLAVLGACHVATASGLRPARPAGRLLLALGGAATLLVAALPEPARGSSAGHALAAGTAFVALTLWPLAAAHTSRSPHTSDGPHTSGGAYTFHGAHESRGPHTSRGAPGSALLRRPAAAAATLTFAVLLAVFFAQLHGGQQIGLTERLLAGAQSLWPAVLTCRAAVAGRAAHRAWAGAGA